MAEEIKFADGMGLVDPKPNQPAFVLNKFYFNADKFSALLQANKSEKGWVYVDMLMSKKGVPYFKLNTFKPIEKAEKPDAIEYPEEKINPDDIPY